MKTAAVMGVVLALAGCAPGDSDKIETRLHNSDTVRSCRSGDLVMRDRRDGRLFLFRRDFLTEGVSSIAEGTSPEQVCV